MSYSFQHSVIPEFFAGLQYRWEWRLLCFWYWFWKSRGEVEFSYPAPDPINRSIWNGDCFLEIFVWEKWFSGWVFTAFWKKHVRYWEFQMGHFDYYPDVSVEKYQFFDCPFLVRDKLDSADLSWAVPAGWSYRAAGIPIYYMDLIKTNDVSCAVDVDREFF